MAKKNKVMYPSQFVRLVGEIVSAKYKEGEDKNGKGYLSFKFTMKEHDSGVRVYIDKFVSLKTEKSDKALGFYKSVEKFIEKVNESEDPIYASIMCKATDTGTQFDWLTNPENEEGNSFIKVGGFPFEITKTDEELEATLSKGSIISAKMIIEDLNDLDLKLSNGNYDYPKELYVSLPEEYSEHLDNFEYSKGYDFKLKLLKGKKVQVEEGKFNFNTDESATYEPDRIIVVGVNQVDLTPESEKGDSSKSKGKTKKVPVDVF